MRFTLIVLVLAGMTAGCGGRPPAPTAPSSQAPRHDGPTFTITGTVVDSLGNPVLRGNAAATQGGTVTAAGIVIDGLFTLHGVPSGTTNLQVSSFAYPRQSVTLSVASDVTVNVVMTGNFDLTGIVSRADTSAPLAGLVVYLNGRYRATTDAAGHYHIAGVLDAGPFSGLANGVWTAADGFDADVEYVTSGSQDLRLHPSRRVPIGASQVIVAPDDSVCSNNTQEIGWGDVGYRCRIVHVTAPSTGILTVEVVSASGDHFPLDVETPRGGCCDLSNPRSLKVSAGDDVALFIELPESATTSQSFTLTTALAAAQLARSTDQLPPETRRSTRARR